MDTEFGKPETINRVHTQRMTTAQLRLLGVLALQDIPDTIQHLQVSLVRVLLDSRDKSPRHGTRRLSSNGCVGTCLIVLAAAPQNDVGRARLGAYRLLVGLVAAHGRLEQLAEAAHDSAHIALGVRHGGAQETLAGLLGEVRLLEGALGRVHIGKVENGARVARVEDARQAHTGLERCHTYRVDLVVDNVACLLEVDRVDDLIVAVVFVAVRVLCLTAVPYTCLSVCFENRNGKGEESNSQTYQSSARTEHHWVAHP